MQNSLCNEQRPNGLEARGHEASVETILGVIPARAGSKSIPDKSIAPVGGRPLIAWTIDASRAAGVLTRVVVTTDSPRIAEVAKQCGAETPFLRPSELARDETPGIEPVIHAVRWLDEHEGFRPDYAIVLQPTSPLRTPQDIEAAVTLARQRQADAVVSVCAAHQHPFWMKSIYDDGRMVDFLPLTKAYARRQELPPAFALNGAIYLVQRDVLLERQTFYTDRTYAYVMPPERSLDVDSPWEMYLAELILTHRGRHEVG